MTRPRRIIPILAALAVVAVATPIAWYLGSPVFLRVELQEPPVAALEPTTGTAVDPASPAPASSPIATAPSAAASASGTAPSVSAQPPTPVPWTPAPALTGRFKGTDDFHFGRGTAILREVEPGRWVVRLEEFSVRNGPDLYVVLSPDRAGYDASAVEVGRLRATDGSFNMRVPAGTDVSRARSVLIWCKQFSHLFAVAPLDG
jgi:Electron transfer DM13